MACAAGMAQAQSAATAAVAQADQTEARKTYRIAAGPVNEVLASFAIAAGVSITIPPTLVQGKVSPGLQGSFGVRDGFAQLLEGTGLEATSTSGGAYILRAGAGPAGAAQGSTLAEVRVTADAVGPTTTEGSRSYTTPATAAATGLTLSLRDTPQSVSVLTRQQIEDQNITSLGQAMKSVTGIYAVSSDSDRTDIYARGFYVDNYQYDGVPTTVSTDFFGASTTDPTVYDRIEVVRGATGLLTGAGEPSASINLVRKHADSKVLTGSASIGAGTWNTYRASVDLTTPLTQDGRIRARVAASLEDRDSYMDLYQGKRQVLYGIVDADLTPNTKASIGVEYQANRPTSSSWGGLPLVFSDGSFTSWDRSKTPATNWTYWNTTSTTTFASLEHRFDNGWKAKANLSHRESEQDAKLLYLYGDLDRATGTGLGGLAGYYGFTFQQNSVDLQASGPLEMWGRKHELVVGLTNTQNTYVQANHARTSPLASTGNFYQWDGSYAEPNWSPLLTTSGIDKTRQTAVYSALRLSLADRLKLIIGGRQNSWETESLTEKRSQNVFTPYAGLIYDLSESYSAYASYTDIFKPQNYRDVTGALLDPVTGKAYEAGVKGEHFNGALNSAFSVFRIEQENVAVQDGANLVPNSSANAYYGAKGVVSQGFEVQLAGELAPGWSVSTGFARTVAVDGKDAALNTWAPRTMVTLFSSYRLRGDWQALTVGGGVNWQNRVYDEGTGYAQGSFGVYSLMARYEFTPQLSGQLNINNLFDKTYYDNLSGQGYFGAPRNVMATLNYKF
jgi:outer membrane receptor for ferric coprogen and ferric-rhodotorulic acid